MVVHLFLNNNKALDFLPINSIKNGGITEMRKEFVAVLSQSLLKYNIFDATSHATSVAVLSQSLLKYNPLCVYCERKGVAVLSQSLLKYN